MNLISRQLVQSIMMQLAKFKGGEMYSGLFQHLGEVKMKNGYRIIINNNPNNSTWIAVCYASRYGQIYVCEKDFTQKCMRDSTIQILQNDWPLRWKGKKYLNFYLYYQGEFNYMMRHTEKQKGTEYLRTNFGLETYVGGFKYDKRHTDEGAEDLLVIRNGGTIVQRIEGRWENGNKQGKFFDKTPVQNWKNGKQSFQNDKQSKGGRKFRLVNQRFYYNDVQINDGKDLKRVGKPTQQIVDEFNLGITPEGVLSLRKGQCLFSQMVDLFFKHLNASFDNYTQRRHNMRAFTVFMFEKLVPSGKVSSQRHNKVEINYNALESLGEVYNNTTTIFEVNPLILLPLNRDQSHFALGAIKTKIERDPLQRSLKKVSFKIYYLDSLHSTQQNVPVIIREYIKKQIQNHVDNSEDKSIYLEALKSQNIADFKKLQFSRQKNEVDCGVFTCLYGLLLTIEVCLPGQYSINWIWDKQPGNDQQIIQSIRDIIKEDAYAGIHEFFNLLLNKLIKFKIIKKGQKQKMTKPQQQPLQYQKQTR